MPVLHGRPGIQQFPSRHAKLRCMRATSIAAVFLALAPLGAATLTGRWDASVKVGELEIPFRFELSGDGSKIQGSFFNGDEPFTSTSGRFAGGSLTLEWAHYASKLEAKLQDGVLEGSYTRPGTSSVSVYAFHAKRHADVAPDAAAPSIAGMWNIPTKSSKGELAWRFIVRQSGADVSAAILRVDGDTGALTGTYRGGKFVLSHFSGARPMLLEVTPAADGSLDLLQNGKTKMTAIRWDVAQAKGLAEPTDPLRHTSVRDPTEPFRFSSPDLSGRTISNTDARFRGKVVLVDIMGSWCPNCHDETPFLVELYRKYRSQGLEIVALSFEESDQFKDPARLRSFVKRYGIDYTVLLAGEYDHAKEIVGQQTVNWDAWPTTFFLGRDGLVREVHAGFPSSASGELFRQAKDEFAAEVERLLHENQRSKR